MTFRRSQRASTLLLAWDGITGWTSEGKPVTRDGAVGTFARSTMATAVDRFGRVYVVPGGYPAHTHRFNAASQLWEPVGVLFEGSATNLCIRSQEFDNAAWSKGTGITVTANDIVAPDGTLTADRLNNDASLGSQAVVSASSIAVTGDGEKCAAIYLKAGTATQTDVLFWDNTVGVARHAVNVAWSGGVPTPSTQAGAGTIYPVERFFADWYRILFSATGVVAANSNRLNIYPTGTGQLAGNVYAWGGYVRNSAVPGSYIPTTSAAAARGADLWSLPFLRLPGNLTVYLDTVDYGSCQALSTVLLRVGSSAGGSTSGVLLACNPNLGDVRISTFDAAGTAKTVDLTSAACAIGDRQEILAAILAAGIKGGRSLNGGAEVTSGPAAAQAHPSTYAVATVQTPNSGVWGHTIRALKIAVDDATLAELRAA